MSNKLDRLRQTAPSIAEIVAPPKVSLRRRLRPFIAAAVAVGALVLCLALWAGGPPPPRYAWEKVERDDMALTITTSGALSPQVSAKITSPISGTVAAILADFGAHVTAGQVLARLDTAVLD